MADANPANPAAGQRKPAGEPLQGNGKRKPKAKAKEETSNTKKFGTGNKLKMTSR